MLGTSRCPYHSLEDFDWGLSRPEGQLRPETLAVDHFLPQNEAYYNINGTPDGRERMPSKDMNSRQRVLTALEHREPDRVPIDLSSALATGIHRQAYIRLLECLGLEEEIEIWDPVSQAARPSETVLELVGADVRGVIMDAPKGASRILPDDTIIDEWGTTWCMPPGSTCYTPIDFPLRNATSKDLESYPWPDGKDPERVARPTEEVRRLHEQTPYATIGMVSWMSLCRAQYLMGFETFLENLVIQPRLAEEVLERISVFQTDLAAAFLEKAGPYLDVVGLGDDFSTQLGPLMSPRMWRKFFKPRLKKYIEGIRTKTRAKVWFHSCGSVYWAIRDLIECGVDILNPVQVMAKDMDSARLTREFGTSLSFWGAIDTQQILPFGTPEQVEAEVKQRLRDLAPDGGYVLASCHNIEADVHGENVWAMFQAAQRWGKYPLNV